MDADHDIANRNPPIIGRSDFKNRRPLFAEGAAAFAESLTDLAQFQGDSSRRTTRAGVWRADCSRAPVGVRPERLRVTRTRGRAPASASPHRLQRAFPSEPDRTQDERTRQAGSRSGCHRDAASTRAPRRRPLVAFRLLASSTTRARCPIRTTKESPSHRSRSARPDRSHFFGRTTTRSTVMRSALGRSPAEAFSNERRTRT